ncbi:MAG: DNA mismatch repair protein MutT [Cytophagales bacterium CG12_big_fil_rev_8_21_14_0_65_40_12]|nr:MAG: DNA mismatch repair protein MutT [Cytophagales bacterium CG12_big_fil_rev_8_21_14_0_65_40_12]PIW05758.1 MAG: DNA mismatch repair protein MutT [Cytophagales bacterium CG17_big_fil_post_rev_8_21_14_2_50_40_13]
MKIIDKLAWLEIQNGKILVAKTRGREVFYIPGGKREIGETDEQALLREIEEELSVHLIREDLKHYGVFQAQAHGHAEGIIVKMTCYQGAYFGSVQASSEIEAIAWVNHKDKEMVSFVDRIIFDDLNAKGLLA